MTDPEFVTRIIDVCANEAGVSRKEFLNTREQRVCKFRDDAIYLAREHTDLAFEALAELFGQRHHTTLIQSHRKAGMRLTRNLIRKGGQSWSEWHQHLLAKVNEQ